MHLSNGICKSLFCMTALFFLLSGCRFGQRNDLEAGSGLSNSSVGFSVPIPPDVAAKLQGKVEVKLTMWRSAEGVKPENPKVEKTATGWRCDRVVSERSGQIEQGTATGSDSKISVSFSEFRCGSSAGQEGSEVKETLGRRLNPGLTYTGAELQVIGIPLSGNGRMIVYEGTIRREFEVALGELTPLDIVVSCTQNAQTAGICAGKSREIKAVGFAGDEVKVTANTGVAVSVKIEEEEILSADQKRKLVDDCLNAIVANSVAAREHCDTNKIDDSLCTSLLALANSATQRSNMNIDETFEKCMTAKFLAEQ